MNTQNRQWTGKTGGGSFGQKSLFAILAKINVSVVYPILSIVIPFYLLFGRKGYKAISTYFQNRFGMNRFQAFFATCKNHITFGKVVLDKFALLAGNTNQFSITVDNIDVFNQAIDQPQGFFVASAHVGNFELAGYCLHQDKKRLNGIAFGGESETMLKRRAEAFEKSHLKLIPVCEDMSHLFAIKEAIELGEIITIPCDRLFGSPKSYTCNFLGKPAEFPIGTFRIAAQLDAPIYVVFIMKERGRNYHGYVKQLTPPANETSSIKKAEYLGKQYVTELEAIVKKYPHQWFNYYDFWNEL